MRGTPTNIIPAITDAVKSCESLVGELTVRQPPRQSRRLRAGRRRNSRRQCAALCRLGDARNHRHSPPCPCRPALQLLHIQAAPTRSATACRCRPLGSSRPLRTQGVEERVRGVGIRHHTVGVRRQHKPVLRSRGLRYMVQQISFGLSGLDLGL